MAKRHGAIGAKNTKGMRKPGKTQKRLAAKRAMIAAKKKR